jgi:hypothetical protein
MTSNEAIVRAAYRTAEGDVRDLEGWRDAFTEDGVFNDIANGASYTGGRLGDLVTYMASLLPDVHRELLRVHESGNCYVSMNIMLAQMGVYPDFASAVKPSPAV